MKLINILVVGFIVLSLMSCQREKEVGKREIKKKRHYLNSEDFKKSKYFDEDQIKTAKYDVKTKGSCISYGKLELYYTYNDSKKEEIIPYTLIMVEKYNHFKYASTAFRNLLEFYTDAKYEFDGSNTSLVPYLNNLKKLNSSQKEYLLYFLKIGAKNKSLGSVHYLEILNRNGIGITQNLQRADSLKIILNQLKKENHIKITNN